MKLLLTVLTATLLSACATMPGGVRTFQSNTDGTTHTAMEPGWLAGSMVKLGLYKTSTMPKDDVELIVAVKGNAAATKDGLTINVDGTKTTLSAIDDLSDLDNNGFFRKRYFVKLELIKQMVAGKSVWVKINHVGQTAEEGEFSRGGMSTAKAGFIEFLKTPGL